MASRSFQMAFDIAGKLENSFKGATATATERLQNVQKHIRSLGQGQQRIEKFQHLKRQLRDTRSEYESAQAEVKRLAQEIEASNEPTKDQQQAFEQAKRKSQQLKRSLDKQENQLQELRTEMREAGQSTQNLADQQRNLARQTRLAQRRAEGWSRVANSNVAGSARNAASNVGNLARNASIAGSALSVAAGYAVHNYARGAVETHTWAQRLGMATTKLSELQHVGKQFNVKQGAIIDGLKEMSMRADEFAKTGSGPGAEAFKRLGLSKDQLDKVKGDTEALFNLISERMSGVQDVAARQRIADELLGGQAGEKMTQMLSASNEKIREMRRQAHAVGNIIGEDEGKKAWNFVRAMNAAQGAMKGIQKTVVSEILPKLTKALKSFTQWVKENQGRIEAFAKRFAEKFGAALPKILNLARGIASTTGKVGSLIGKVAELMGGFRNLGIVIAAAFSAKVIGSIFSMGRGLWSMSRGLFQIITSYRATTSATQTATAASKRHILTQKLLNRTTWKTAANLVKQKVATVALATYQRTVSAATKIWAGAQWALNVAMNANPIGLLITGAAALGGLAYYVVTRWNKVKSFFTGLWEWISNIDFLGGIKKAILTASPVGWLLRAFKPAMNWLSNLSFVQAGKDLIGTIISGITAKAGDLLKKAKEALGPLGKLIPGSDAEEGPLSKLTKAGQAIPKTMAKGIEQTAPVLQKTAKGAMVGAAAATTFASPAAGNLAGNQEAQARIRPVMERAPQLQDQEARARIIPEMGRVPVAANQEAQARIRPVMERAPQLQEAQRPSRQMPTVQAGPAGGGTSRRPQVNITNNYNIGGGSPEEVSDEIRKAGSDAAQDTRQAVENYFSEQIRLGYH